jgi:hypothetical protein
MIGSFAKAVPPLALAAASKALAGANESDSGDACW